MSHGDIAISVRNLSKAYVIAHNATRHTTLAEAMMHRVRRPWARPTHETFWALRDLSLDIKKGEVVGVIGRNGAGKSTFLKILSRITEPTSGRIDLYGRVGSLLEVGTGFHPELTGRENIYLNGQILGMRRREIDRQFDAIVDFAGVEQFLDTPVKRYSSGMYVRLAFAVSAHLRSEILVVDEVLAVGDAEFQKKCLGKMDDVARSGRTVLFVSHNTAAVSGLCTKAIILKAGRLDFAGETSAALDRYLAAGAFGSDAEETALDQYRVPSAIPMMTRVRLLGRDGGMQASFNAGEDIAIEVSFSPHANVSLRRVMMGVIVNSSMGAPVGAINMRMSGQTAAIEPDVPGTVVCKLIRPRLAPGRYSLDIYFGDGASDFDVLKGVIGFTVENTDFYGTGVAAFAHLGPMLLEADWGVRQSESALVETK
jgi:lipopolysaccharide transport system ATP-binding protein